jgi:ubiquinone/menaquinone biosynthesis C-methylase UbiE
MATGRKPSRPADLLRRGPDRSAALAQYEARAATYDFELALFEPIRERAIERLALRPGDTVLDVGCGTGLSLERLQRGVGAAGHVVGIEQCPAMIAQAQHRSCVQESENVTLLCAPAEEAPIHGRADAALFHFTHDVLRRPAALDQVLRHLKPGARLVACGLQWASPWAVPLNLFVWGAAMRSVSSLRGLDMPWSLLAERVRGLKVEELLLGAVFLARGVRA